MRSRPSSAHAPQAARFQCVIERTFVLEAERRVVGVVKPFIEIGRLQLRIAHEHDFHRAAIVGFPAQGDDLLERLRGGDPYFVDHRQIEAQIDSPDSALMNLQSLPIATETAWSTTVLPELAKATPSAISLTWSSWVAT